MNLYLDTEFDGHGGFVISLALAAEDGSYWYGIFAPYAFDPWVKENVQPKLYAMKPTIQGNDAVLRFSLREYLQAREISAIWADWPDDFAHLMRLMSGSSYADSFMVPCIRPEKVKPRSEIKNPLTGTWTKRDDKSGKFMDVKAKPFAGVRKAKAK